MAELQYLAWSSFLLTSDAGVSVLIDPWLTGDAEAGVPASPRQPADLAGCDLVLVSHAARDHLGQAFQIVSTGSAQIAGWLDVRVLAVEAGIDEARTVTLIPNSPFRIGDLTIIPTEARHHSATRREDGGWLIGKALSYFIGIDGGGCVFIGGDTAISPDLELYGELYRPTVAVLGVGGIPHPGRQPIVEMSPYEAALAARMLGVAVAIPCHYVPGTTAPGEFTQHVSASAPQAEAVVLDAGASVRVPQARP